MSLPLLSKKGIAVCIGLFMMLSIAGSATAEEYHNPAIQDKDSIDYWLDRGGLLSTYGNFKAAVQAYQKALEKAPNDSETLFDLAIAYAELGDYQLALTNIDKALLLSPENGQYHYGRAWVLIRAGQADQADPDMKKAAELGNMDAKRYLQREEGQ